MFSSITKQISSDTKLILNYPSEAFAPYACHYDDVTMLTKNGEILQTIKISGFSYEFDGTGSSDLRKAVRHAIKNHIKSAGYSVWLHTIRRRANIDQGGDFGDFFSDNLHQEWVKKNYLNDKFINELYITIIHEAEPFRIKNLTGFIRSLFLGAQINHFTEYLHNAYVSLNRIVESIMEDLSYYKPYRLGMREELDGMYSEPMELYDTIIHLKPHKMPVPIVDLSNFLVTHKMAVGHNIIEIKKGNEKHFAAIFSMKECNDLSIRAIDLFLQLPIQFVMTQTIDFIPAEDAKKKFEYQNYILSVSRDEDVRYSSALQNIFETETNDPTDFCNTQMTLMCINEDFNLLNHQLMRLSREFEKLGVVAYREDIALEQCFWSQLPANFSFISRKITTSTSNTAAFASLNNFPAGNFRNIWGDAVTILRTIMGTPYFFNFHSNKNGNNIIISPLNTGSTTFINFLVSQAKKYNPKIRYISSDNSSNIFIKALDGLNQDLQSEVGFNIFQLYNSGDSQTLFYDYFKILFNIEENDDKFPIIKQILDDLVLLPEENKSFDKLHEIISNSALSEATKYEFIAILKNLIKSGKYYGLFNCNNNNIIDFKKSDIININYSKISASDVREKELISLLIIYYIEKIILEDNKQIILIDRLPIFENKILIERFNHLLTKAKENGIVVIYVTDAHVTETNQSLFINSLSHFANQIYMTKCLDDKNRNLFNLTPQDIKTINSFKLINRNFLLKSPRDTMALELNLAGLNHLLPVLACNEEDMNDVNNIITSAGNHPNEWLPAFYKRLIKDEA